MSKLNELYQAIDNYTQKEKRTIEDLINDPELLDLFTQENECDKLLYYAGVENNYIDIAKLLLAKMEGVTHFAVNTFSHACKKGHTELAKLLLDSNAASIQPKSLTDACTSGNIELVRLLLDRGANPRLETPAVGGSINEALNGACSIGDIAIFDLLVANGAQVKDFDTSWKNPYYTAAINGQVAMFKHLFDRKPLDETLNLKSVLALLFPICQADEPGLLQILKDHNVDVFDDTNNKTDIPSLSRYLSAHTSLLEELLYHASTNNSIKILNTLKPNATNINIFLRSNRTYPLHIACKQGYVDLVERFLAIGANPNLVFGTLADSYTALHHACELNHVDIVDRLLHSGRCDINAISENGNTALTCLLHTKQPLIDIFDKLIIHGADFNYCNNKDNNSVLITAVIEGHVDIVERLLGLGVDVNCPTMRGSSGQRLPGLATAVTPLMHAVIWERIEIVKLLLNHPHIDINATDSTGCTAADLAPRSPENLKLEYLKLFNDYNDKHPQDTSSSRPSM